MKKSINVFPAVILPVIFFVLSYYLLSIKGGYAVGGTDDPDYAYLMNALRIATWNSSFLMQHPGTTLQVFGAFILSVKYTLTGLFGKVETLPIEVISHPEAYLYAINISINGFISLALLWLGITSYRQGRKWSLALMLQSFPFLSVVALDYSARVAPESFLILVMAVLMWTLLPFLFKDESQLNRRHSIALGLALALACATKITALPLLLFVFVIPDVRNRMFAFAAFFVGFLVFVIPIWSRFPMYFTWMKNLIMHKGQYGGGELGIVDPHQFNDNLLALWNAFYWHYLLAGLVVFWLIYNALKRKSVEKTTVGKNDGRWLIILVIILMTQTIMTGKHFRLHYMLPSLLLMSLTVVVLWRHIQSRYALKTMQSRFFMVPVVGIVLMSLSDSVSASLSKVAVMQRTHMLAIADAQHNQQQINKIGRGCITILYPHSSIQKAALVFGNIWSQSLFYKEFRALYPNTYIYNLFGEKNAILFQGFKQGASKKMVLNGLRQGQCFLLRAPATLSGIQKKNNILQLVPLNNNTQERLYRIVGVN